MARKTGPTRPSTVPLSVAKHLFPREELRLLFRQHPIPLVPHLAAMIGALLAAIAVSQLPGIADAERVVAWILWAFLAARLLTAAASYPNYRIVVTDRRVLVVWGVFTSEFAPIALPDVDEIGVRQSVRGKVFRYGTITLTPAAGTPSTFTFMPWPQHLYWELLRRGEHAEED